MANSIVDKNQRSELLQRVIRDVLEGNQLKHAVAAQGISLYQFHDWISGDREAAIAYSRARELHSDVLVDEAKHIADTEPDAAKARNQIEIRKWIASKHNSRTYGDRIDLNVTQTLDIGATLAEAKARLLRPVRDQLTNDESQVVDVQGKFTLPRCDSISVDAPEPGAAPDIFE